MKCQYALVCNDDILLAPYSIDALIKDYNENSEALVLTGRDYKHLLPEADSIFELPQPEPDLQESPDFACFVINQAAYEVIGSFDENFQKAYFEDNDYRRRIRLLGCHAFNDGAAPFYHYGSQTQNHGGPVVSSQEFVTNRNYYVAKWGGVVGHEKFVHPYNNTSFSVSMWKNVKIQGVALP